MIFKTYFRQQHTSKWSSFSWLERGNNDGITAPLSTYSNEDIRDYYCWKEVVKEAKILPILGRKDHMSFIVID